MTPLVKAFFDEQTNTVSYVVQEPQGQACAIVDSVLDFDHAAGRTDTRSADEIISQLEIDLDALPHHRGIVVTSAGVMPPMCKPETIKEVCEWVKQYPARMN